MRLWVQLELVGFLERCRCVNFPTAIMAPLRENITIGSTNTSAVGALCVLGTSPPRFGYRECKTGSSTCTLVESRAGARCLQDLFVISPVSVYTQGRRLQIQPRRPFAARQCDKGPLFSRVKSEARPDGGDRGVSLGGWLASVGEE